MAETKATPSNPADSPFDFLNEVVDTDGIENGVFLHLEFDGVPLYLDGAAQKQPARIRVRSTSSTRFEAYLDRVQRRTVERQRRGGKLNKAQKEQIIKDLKKDGPESFAELAVEFENVSRKNPGVIAPPREDLIAFAMNPHNRWAVDQVLEFAAEDGNYSGLKTPSGNAGAGDEPKT